MGQISLGISKSCSTQLSAADSGSGRTGSRAADQPTDPVLNPIVKEINLNQVLEEACLATGATGAAIAFLRGADMVCCATTGPNAPDLGTRLDPRIGLTGRCIQTCELQQCSDTETDPRVDLCACRRLGVRSIAVLPVMDSDKLCGVFEILSSRPNAFGDNDLTGLRILANRILQSKTPRWKASAIAPRENLRVNPRQEEPRRRRKGFLATWQRNTKSRHRGSWMAIRLAVVVALAILLGWMLGHASWKIAVDQAEIQTSRPHDFQRK
jgi:hypothetical protein